MAEPRSLLDPFGFWRFVGTRLEKSLVRAGDRGVNSEEFAKLMHKALAASLIAGNLAKALTQRVQELLNVPTRADIQALGERLQLIEDRLVGIAASVEPARPSQARHPAVLRLAVPPRTRKPPASASESAPEPAPVAKAKPRAGARKTRKARA